MGAERVTWVSDHGVTWRVEREPDESIYYRLLRWTELGWRVAGAGFSSRDAAVAAAYEPNHKS